MEGPIHIVGAGSIGIALAAILAQNGREVQLIRASDPYQLSAWRSVTVLLPENREYSARVETVGLLRAGRLRGPVLVCSKNHANAALALQLRPLITSSPVLLLQNGLHIERPFLKNLFPALYRGVLFATSQTIGPDQVRLRPVSDSRVGAVQGNEAELESLVDAIHTSMFPFVSERNLDPVIWKKVIINAAFNSICPLLDVDNGIFYRNEEAMALAERVIAECVPLANATGIRLTATEIRDTLLSISRSSDGQLISTLQDIRLGRTTEIEWLNLELVRVARQLPQPLSLTHTDLLGQLTRMKASLAGSGTRLIQNIQS